ncbi:MAG: hypothetical protein V7746_09240 [Halioglobus sp.]
MISSAIRVRTSALSIVAGLAFWHVQAVAAQAPDPLFDHAGIAVESGNDSASSNSERRIPQLIHGAIYLDTQTPLTLKVIRDDYGFAKEKEYEMDRLPPFNFEFLQNQDVLIPVSRGPIAGTHPMREWILEAGTIQRHPTDVAQYLVTIPFALNELNANCIHNGELQFSIDDQHTMSPVAINVSSETCQYFKFDLSGKIKGTYKPASIPDANELLAASTDQRNARLMVKPVSALVDLYPEFDLSAFGGNGRVPAEDISLYGFIIDDTHYIGECQTRTKKPLLCEEMVLPSYSLAKSLVAGLAAMRLEKLYPGSMQKKIVDSVPECNSSGNWANVSLKQTLNMLSGNYNSNKPRVDETADATIENFFLVETHAEKISFSCNAWPRKSEPGEEFVYHTSDTYLVANAINTLLKEEQGPDADLFDDLVSPLWKLLRLSPVTFQPLRTNDETAQAVAGFGLNLLPDDIARLATALNRGTLAEHLDSTMLESAMQNRPNPQGHFPAEGKFYYRHGFWAYDAQKLLGCDQSVPVPFMSGFGGISVVMMPNDSVYYIFSDGGNYAFTEMIMQSHQIRSMCSH